MSVLSEVYQGLKASSDVTKLLAEGQKSIYHGWSKDAGSYPVLIYGIASDVPHITADNREISHFVTMRIHIVTTNGAFTKLFHAVNAVMVNLGYMRKMCNEVNDDDLRIMVCDYTISKKVEE